jgi:hypothetical protein
VPCQGKCVLLWLKTIKSTCDVGPIYRIIVARGVPGDLHAGAAHVRRTCGVEIERGDCDKAICDRKSPSAVLAHVRVPAFDAGQSSVVRHPCPHFANNHRCLPFRSSSQRLREPVRSLSWQGWQRRAENACASCGCGCGLGLELMNLDVALWISRQVESRACCTVSVGAPVAVGISPATCC